MADLWNAVLAFSVLTRFTLCGEPKYESPPLNVGLTTPEIIGNYGYRVETHQVWTRDRYQLTLHRIPHAKNQTLGDRQPVLLMHGVLATSAQFVEMGPENGLGFILADKGYDVWLGNVRGNSYSQKHERHTSDNWRFWDFSFHEIGLYDLPAMIDFILSITSKENMYYIGYSQGSTAAFVLLSLAPYYNRKMKVVISLAPMAFMSNAKSQFLKALEPINNKFQLPLVVLGGFEFTPRHVYFTKFGQKVCEEEAKYKELCDNVLFLICGHDSKNLNETMLPIMLNNVPDRAPSKIFHHWTQLMVSKKFRAYDYGSHYNIQKYMGAIAPSYDLSLITGRVALIYSTNDNMASVLDVEDLMSRLPNVVENYEVKSPHFNHIDFIWSTEAVSLVYNKVLEFLEKYRNIYSTETANSAHIKDDVFQDGMFNKLTTDALNQGLLPIMYPARGPTGLFKPLPTGVLQQFADQFNNIYQPNYPNQVVDPLYGIYQQPIQNKLTLDDIYGPI